MKFKPQTTIASIVLVALACAFFIGPAAFAQSSTQPDLAAARVGLPEAARHFGVITSWKPDEWKLSLAHQGRNAEILIGSDRLTIDDRLIALATPVTAEGGTVSMGLEDSAEVFTRLLGREVSEEEIMSAGLVLRATVVGPTLIKNVRYISYPQFTRIIINVSTGRSIEALGVKLSEKRKNLIVEFADSRLAGSEEAIHVNGDIVEVIERVQAKDTARLIVKTVPREIKYEIQKHNDPPRVVIDVASAKPVERSEFPNPPGITPNFPPDYSALPALPSLPGAVVDPEKFPFTVVVIDPGHGGKDNGACGRGGLCEKDVVLEIALNLKKLLKRNPGIKVVLTRTSDYFVPLKERAAIANHAKDGLPGDVFVSIHTNAHKSPKVGGFESFYISDAIDPDSEATAALENAVIDLEVGDEAARSALTPILWDLQFTKFVSQSSELAALTQQELAGRLNTRNRGVRQAQFIVLAGVAMPSILIEVGFISNRIEEANLKTADFRGKCAEAIAAAVLVFKQRRDMRYGAMGRESHP